MLCWVQTDHAEALFISGEIKRLVAASGGMFKWQDFAVLRVYPSFSLLVHFAKVEPM